MNSNRTVGLFLLLVLGWTTLVFMSGDLPLQIRWCQNASKEKLNFRLSFAAHRHPCLSSLISYYLPEKSVPKIIPFTLATDMQCQSESSRRLVLIREVITPSLDKPSQTQTNSGEDSNKRAMTSPLWYPCDMK